MKKGMKGEHLIVSKCLDAVKGSSCLKFYCYRTRVGNLSGERARPFKSFLQAGEMYSEKSFPDSQVLQINMFATAR